MSTLTKILYAAKNWESHLRGLVLGTTRTANGMTFQGTLAAKLTRANGLVDDLGVLSRRVVTDAGVAFMATDFFDGSTEITSFDWHASGTGTATESVSDTAMGTDSGVARVSGTATNPAPGQYRTVATMTYVSPLAITEHGVFSPSTSGTLWDRSVFAAINVVSGDSISFTYTLTCSSGG